MDLLILIILVIEEFLDFENLTLNRFEEVSNVLLILINPVYNFLLNLFKLSADIDFKVANLMENILLLSFHSNIRACSDNVLLVLKLFLDWNILPEILDQLQLFVQSALLLFGLNPSISGWHDCNDHIHKNNGLNESSDTNEKPQDTSMGTFSVVLAFKVKFTQEDKIHGNERFNEINTRERLYPSIIVFFTLYIIAT